jgi:hypothetical protein
VVEALCYICKVAGSSPDEAIEILILPITFQPHWALGFIQPLTEMSIRNRKILFLGSRERPAHKADNHTAICEPIVYTLWDP